MHQSGSLAHGGEARVTAHIYEDGRMEGQGNSVAVAGGGGGHRDTDGIAASDGLFEIFGSWRAPAAAEEPIEFKFWKRDLKDGEAPQKHTEGAT